MRNASLALAAMVTTIIFISGLITGTLLGFLITDAGFYGGQVCVESEGSGTITEPCDYSDRLLGGCD